MRISLGLVALAGALLICVSSTSDARQADLRVSDVPHGSRTPISRADTLWIFDADFEDLMGDNAGWTSLDLSERTARTNHWHKDTIRINGFEHLGDSTWWCGTYHPCWRQPRGYGNDWTDILERDFPLASWSSPGDEVIFEWDQRIAMEIMYDYGYVEVSADGGASWSTFASFTTPGWEGTPGNSQDWDGDFPGCEGHQTHDLSSYAGLDVALRFRFESDVAYSSQDQYDNPPLHSVLDGAWQLDNFTWSVNDTVRWYDDCESPGENGWAHENLPAEGQTGVTFERHFESFGGHSGWMMAAYDSVSGTMVDGQYSLLLSPPIDISGAPELIVQWEGWVDLGTSGEDRARVRLYSSDEPECVYFGSRETVWPDTTVIPGWNENEFLTSTHAARDWAGLRFQVRNYDPIGTGHSIGIAVDRARVGVPMGTSTPEDAIFTNDIRAVRPNPFNPLTTIEFEVAVTGRGVLRVYNVAGRLVTTLREAVFEPGSYEVTWDGTDDSGERVGSGVYLLRFEVEGGTSASMKAVLLE